MPFEHVTLPPPFSLADAAVPDHADLVVVGNPTNPTAVLHTRDEILALRRPGRIVVVDEAFADAVPGEPESLAGLALPDVVVLRSLTKTWSLAGLRVGYALGDPAVLARMTATRPHWALGTLQLEAITACSEPAAVAEAADGAGPAGGAAHRDGGGIRRRGPRRGRRPCARSCCSPSPMPNSCERSWTPRGSRFVAATRSSVWTAQHLRAAVRPEWPLLLEAIVEALR